MTRGMKRRGRAKGNPRSCTPSCCATYAQVVRLIRATPTPWACTLVIYFFTDLTHGFCTMLPAYFARFGWSVGRSSAFLAVQSTSSIVYFVVTPLALRLLRGTERTLVIVLCVACCAYTSLAAGGWLRSDALLAVPAVLEPASDPAFSLCVARCSRRSCHLLPWAACSPSLGCSTPPPGQSPTCCSPRSSLRPPPTSRAPPDGPPPDRGCSPCSPLCGSSPGNIATGRTVRTLPPLARSDGGRLESWNPAIRGVHSRIPARQGENGVGPSRSTVPACGQSACTMVCVVRSPVSGTRDAVRRGQPRVPRACVRCDCCIGVSAR